MTEIKEKMLLAFIQSAVIGVFLFIGLGLFAGKVFDDHARMEEHLKEATQQIKIELQLLQIKQIETNARVIEMRRMEREKSR